MFLKLNHPIPTCGEDHPIAMANDLDSSFTAEGVVKGISPTWLGCFGSFGALWIYIFL